jgi:hypothetical protein
MISLLFSLSSLWTASRANGSPSANGGASTYLGLKDLHAQEMGGRTDPRVGQAGRPGLILARFGRPFAPVGPHVFMHFAPFICTILTISSSRPRWRFFLHEVRSFTLQSSGMFLCNTLVLATFGSDSSCSRTRMGLLNCSFELVVTLSFMFMFFCKNITLPNAHTKMNLLYH